ncbi:M4 family metallopeptidase [Amycolatopsis rhabdoformis]|uniref:Neutral metalloproteinase n=1 Tax=Amycolatopsis rhabdoformis TaxID=1448059 RepID=A0ABZ1I6X6_9PSEU|nr:M4 family metallopeptidase [Amycolatopsis rhabdoformis]WSE29456.1 M4 family metallopeptidase [Amycolatopsis rhabdoformis]
MTGRRGITTSLATAGLVLSALTIPAATSTAAAAPPPADPLSLAATASDQAASLGALRSSVEEAFHRVGTTAGAAGLYYSAYERTYHGLRVIGGDAVVVADGTGRVRDTTAADTAPLAVPTTAALDAARAADTARRQLPTVDGVAKPDLVVLAGRQPKLAYEVVVTGRTAKAPSSLHVFVDAATGAVLDQRDDWKSEAPAADREARAAAAPLAAGNSFYAGNVSIDTTGSGSSFSMRDPGRTGISCGREGGSVFTGPDDSWGNGSGTDLETACVDVLYSVQTEWTMLRDWLGRNGINGTGGGYPASVGLNDVNAGWDGRSTHFGHSADNQRQATSMDVVGHEFGHGIFQTTPGGAGGSIENGGLNESTGDIFGALTEAYANNPNDRPDYEVGEGVNLNGQGPIRYLYNPSLVRDPNCYSTSLPPEVHAAAGPQNHWFYLLAEGSAPAGKPASPTCNGSSVTGLGIQKAGTIFYNALLKKTSSWNHRAVRKATLETALALYPSSCTEFTTVKAAWDAVSVPAAAGEPTSCGTTTPPTDCAAVTNGTDVAIPDAGATVASSVTVAGCARSASATTRVEVHIVHTYVGDLVLDLVAPDGTAYRLKNSGSDSSDNINTTYTVNASAEAADGTWQLRARDVARVDTGRIDSWSLIV